MGYDNLVRICICEAPWYHDGDEMTDEMFELLERECLRMRAVYKRLRAQTSADVNVEELPPFGKKYRGSWDIESVIPFTREFPEYVFRVYFYTWDLFHIDVSDIRGEHVAKVTSFDFEKFDMPHEFTDVGLHFGDVSVDTFILDREITDEITGKCRVGFDGIAGW